MTRYNSLSIRGIKRRVTSRSRDNQGKIEQETNGTKIKIFLLQRIYKETGVIRFYWGHRSMIRSRNTKNPAPYINTNKHHRFRILNKERLDEWRYDGNKKKDDSMWVSFKGFGGLINTEEKKRPERNLQAQRQNILRLDEEG